MDFLPDNIHWAGNNSIIAAGQGGSPGDHIKCIYSEDESCKLLSTVITVNADTMEPTAVVEKSTFNGMGRLGATGALYVGQQLWVTSNGGQCVSILPGNRPARAPAGK